MAISYINLNLCETCACHLLVLNVAQRQPTINTFTEFSVIQTNLIYNMIEALLKAKYILSTFSLNSLFQLNKNAFKIGHVSLMNWNKLF